MFANLRSREGGSVLGSSFASLAIILESKTSAPDGSFVEGHLREGRGGRINTCILIVSGLPCQGEGCWPLLQMRDPFEDVRELARGCC